MSNSNIHKPVSRWVSFGPIAFMVLGAMWVSYWFGTQSYKYSFPSTQNFENIVDKDEKIKLLKKANKELSHEVALVNRSAKVELAAVEEMKKSLHKKDLDLLKLNQELHFYRTLYSPNEDNTVVQVKVFNLNKDLVTNRYVYDLVLTNVPKKKEKTTGIVGLSVDGEQDGILKRLVFEDVSGEGDSSVKFSFKYFQKLSGSFSLPDDFEPSSVHIKVLHGENKTEPIAITYNWDEVYKDS